jgi:hypothetical protein
VSRKIKDVHFSVAISYASIIGTVIPFSYTLIHSAITGDAFFNYSKIGWFWLILGGLTDSQAISSGIVAYQSDDSTFVSMLSYISVVWAFTSDLLFFN